MGAGSKTSRAKLSTTVSSETYRFLENMVSSGEASNLAEAVDKIIARVRQLESRKRLAQATTQYFNQMASKALAEEATLAHDLVSAGSAIDFDQEL
jgi:hypothetical protein